MSLIDRLAPSALPASSGLSSVESSPRGTCVPRENGHSLSPKLDGDGDGDDAGDGDVVLQ